MVFPSGDPAVVQRRAHPGVVWAVAAVSGVLVYALLLAIHIPRDTGGTTAFRAGEMMPLTLVCTVVAGLVAQFTARGEVGRRLVRRSSRSPSRRSRSPGTRSSRCCPGSPRTRGPRRADASTSGQVIYFKQGLSTDTAAAWARDLRDAVTQR